MPNPNARYDHIIRAALGQPWAILDSKLADIADLLTIRASGEHVPEEQIRAIVAAAQRPPTLAPQGSMIAVLSMVGTISQRANLMSEFSGGVSTDRLGQVFDEVINDRQVSAVVFDVDSPGGGVSGVPELASKIRAARGTKPIVAVANTLMASAAYWLASATDEIVGSPSAEVGSIGVFTMHRDMSAALEKAGERITVIKAGAFKTEGHPFGPLDDEALEEQQRRVDMVYRMFVGDVASGRGVSTSKVLSDFGQGRVIEADRAVTLGMIDRVETMEATLARLSTVEGRDRVMQRGAEAGSLARSASEYDSAGERINALEARVARLESGDNEAGPARLDIDIEAVSAALAAAMKETR